MPLEADAIAQVRLRPGHRTASVCDDHDPIDAQGMHRQHTTGQHLRPQMTARTAQNLRVPDLQPDHGQWIKPTIHAGQQAQTGAGPAVQIAMFESLGIGGIGRQ